jgi:hypothetical protein
MPRFSLKDILRGITLASIGFGMLAVAFTTEHPPTSKGSMWVQEFLVTFGGMLVGYGFAFPFKWPPHQYILAMMGMFAATSWQSGSSFGLIVYVGLSALLCSTWAIANRRAKRKINQDNPPSAH